MSGRRGPMVTRALVLLAIVVGLAVLFYVFEFVVPRFFPANF